MHQLVLTILQRIIPKRKNAHPAGKKFNRMYLGAVSAVHLLIFSGKSPERCFSGMMNDEILLSQFEELAERLEILVRDENINLEESFTAGGLCRVDGKYILILNSKATINEKIQVMIKTLQQFDLDTIYVKPVLRELLEGHNDYGGET